MESLKDGLIGLTLESALLVRVLLETAFWFLALHWLMHEMGIPL